jgi:hypothetical protein
LILCLYQPGKKREREKEGGRKQKELEARPLQVGSGIPRRIKSIKGDQLRSQSQSKSKKNKRHSSRGGISRRRVPAKKGKRIEREERIPRKAKLELLARWKNRVVGGSGGRSIESSRSW